MRWSFSHISSTFLPHASKSFKKTEWDLDIRWITILKMNMLVDTMYSSSLIRMIAKNICVWKTTCNQLRVQCSNLLFYYLTLYNDVALLRMYLRLIEIMLKIQAWVIVCKWLLLFINCCRRWLHNRAFWDYCLFV